MNVAFKYNMSFETSRHGDNPFINVPLIDGESKNYEIANFIQEQGPSFTQEIIDEASSFLNNPAAFGGEEILTSASDDSVTVIKSPPRAVFETGGRRLEIPLTDFIQILQEWKAFLQSIPHLHWLSNR